MTDSWKKCWTCSVRTPYDNGFCESCFKSIPETLRPIYDLAKELPQPWKGLVNTALCEGIFAERRARDRPKKLTLEDLDIDI